MTDKDVADDNDICTDGASTLTDDNIIRTLPLETAQKKVPQDVTAPTITMSKGEFCRLKHELGEKDRKLVALRNIHLLLREKELEISSLKEKNRTQDDALMLSEMRYSQLVKLTAKSAKYGEKPNLETERYVAKTHPDCEDADVLKVGVRYSKRSEESSNFSKIHDQELDKQADGLVEDISEQTRQETLVTKHSEKDALDTNETRFEHHQYHRHAVPNVESAEPTKQATESKNENSENEGESFVKVKEKPVVMPPTTATPVKVSSDAPGFSKDLVGKLIQQNARLKRVLRQVISRQGFNMEEYLDRQEYVSVVEQLRSEIRLLQLRGKDKDELLATVGTLDPSGLAGSNLKLQKTVQRQNRTLTVKTAMVDAFSSRCEELTTEIKRLKSILVLEKYDTTPRLKSQRPLPVSGLAVDGNTDGMQGRTSSLDEADGRDTSTTGTEDFEGNKISPIICERCEREFNASEKDKFLEHCKRCTDD